MTPSAPTRLLGGLSPAQFMRRHWQRRPLVVRGALDAAPRLLAPARLFALAARDDVESRLVVREGEHWSLRPGPIARRALPRLDRPGWTLLVQGVDLHEQTVHELLARFRFVGDARLDDAMVSFASDGGGVGPHVDSYDVFLLQLAGSRVWRVGRPGRARLRDDVPLKMLAGFAPRHEWRLDAGDLLYLPPGWGHDGVAAGACLTCSIGFRSPDAATLAAELLQRAGDDLPAGGSPRYADRDAAPAAHPARIPAALARFAEQAVERALADRSARRRRLGEWLSEPKPGTGFVRADGAGGAHAESALVLDRRTRMLYDRSHVFVNGEAWPARGDDATLLRRLADTRQLAAADRRRASRALRERLAEWCEAGWCRPLAGRAEDDERSEP